MKLMYLICCVACGYVVYDLITAKADCEEAILQSTRSAHALLHNTLDDNAKDKCGKLASKAEAARGLVGAGR